MGIMDIIRKLKERKEQEKEYEEQGRMIQKVEARKLSSDERELLRFKAEERAKLVRKILDGKRKQINDKIWSGKDGNPAYAKNIMVGQKELYKENKNIFVNKTKVFNQPDLFFRR